MAQASFDITLTAIERLKFLFGQDDREGVFFRIRVEGGGCSGFQYMFSLDDQTTDEDQVFEKNDVKVAIDNISAPFLDGAELDYVDNFGGSMLKINNPNASSSCGCGTSFSV